MDAALARAGYERIGLDHYARPDDELAEAARSGRMRRNFQGYTVDEAQVLVPIGQTAIGRFPEGYVQNARAADDWAGAVAAGRLSVERGVEITAEDRLRAAVIERVMCGLQADVAEVCAAEGFPADALDEGLERARALQADGLCRVEGTRVIVEPAARPLVRAVAACFDDRMAGAEGRHSRAV